MQQDVTDRKLQEFQSLHRFQAGIHSKTREKQNQAQVKALGNFKTNVRRSIVFRCKLPLLRRYLTHFVGLASCCLHIPHMCSRLAALIHTPTQL
jgi:hypothetical protein